MLGCVLLFSSLALARGATELSNATVPAAEASDIILTEVSTIDELLSAFYTNASHIRISAHLDMQEYSSSLPKAGVMFAASGHLESITGRCTGPTPIVHGQPPLGQLRQGQCLIQLSSGFIGWFDEAASNVWLNNIYVHSPVHLYWYEGHKRDILVHWRPRQPASLWLTNTTLQGGGSGLIARAASVYAEGVRFRSYTRAVEAWVGADVSMVDCSWRNPVEVYLLKELVVKAEPEEDTRMRIERCELKTALHAVDVSAGAAIFSDVTKFDDSVASQLTAALLAPLTSEDFTSSAFHDYATSEQDGDDAHDQLSKHSDADVTEGAGPHGLKGAGSEDVQAREERMKTARTRWERAERLRPQFLSSDASVFQKLKEDVAMANTVKATTFNISDKNAKQQGLPTPTPPDNSASEHDRTTRILGGIIIVLALALMLAVGCSIGLCTARALPVLRNRNGSKDQKQLSEDAHGTGVVRGTGTGGEAAKQRRRRGGAKTEDEAVLLPISDADDDNK